MNFSIGAEWIWEHISEDGKIIETKRAHNIVPTLGLNSILNVAFHNVTVIYPWYVLLWNLPVSYVPTSADTYAVPGFTEYTGYNEANRVQFSEAAATGGVITNSASRAIFTFTSESMIYGSALVGGGGAASTKGDTAGGGVLLSSVAMGTPGNYTIGQVVRVTVNITLVSS